MTVVSHISRPGDAPQSLLHAWQRVSVAQARRVLLYPRMLVGQHSPFFLQPVARAVHLAFHLTPYARP